MAKENGKIGLNYSETMIDKPPSYLLAFAEIWFSLEHHLLCSPFKWRLLLSHPVAEVLSNLVFPDK